MLNYTADKIELIEIHSDLKSKRFSDDDAEPRMFNTIFSIPNPADELTKFLSENTTENNKIISETKTQFIIGDMLAKYLNISTVGPYISLIKNEYKTKIINVLLGDFVLDKTSGFNSSMCREASNIMLYNNTDKEIVFRYIPFQATHINKELYDTLSKEEKTSVMKTDVLNLHPSKEEIIKRWGIKKLIVSPGAMAIYPSENIYIINPDISYVGDVITLRGYMHFNSEHKNAEAKLENKIELKVKA